MSWDPVNGYTKESYTDFPDHEEASADLSNVTSLAPDRSQLLSADAVNFPNHENSQQGTPLLTSAPVIAGNPHIQWYKGN